MDELAAQLRRSRAVHLLLPLFFLSGATALTYQTLWVRELQIELFGTSTFAISTVLAAFMGGLALGGFLMARVADELERPLRLYGWLEVGIGLYALVFPLVVQALQPIYLEAWRSLTPGPVTFGIIQFAIVTTSLILPTAAMGATLPLLARFATERLGAAGNRVGTLYAVNTAGAVVGTALCGFWLLPEFGRFATTGLAASANLGLGVAAIALSSWAGGRERDVVDDLPPETPRSNVMIPVTVALGLAGFSALVYEVAWTRLLGLMLGASTYTFSLMLLSFLIGIAAGGALGGPLADRLFARRGPVGVLVAFAILEASIALVSYGMMYLYPQLPFLYVWLFDAFGAGSRPSRMWEVSLLVAGLIMTPPAILMGMHFPIAVRAVVGDEAKLGEPVGVLYGVNTLGGVFGAFLAGFVFLPSIQLQGTIYVAAIVELAAAGVLLVAAARLLPRPAGRARYAPAVVSVAGLAVALGLVASRPPWDPLLMTAGMYHYVSHFDDHSRKGIREYALDLYELVYYREGLSSVVTVARNRDSNNMWLANNGKVDASTTSDMPTQVLCSLLPLQFVEDPDDVLVIGLASGITAGALSLVDDVERLDIVELEPAIEAAAREFSTYNHAVLDDPRVNLVFNDGRNHILLTEPGTYDVIVSEPSNPWITGVSNLFTRDFFELGRSRLKPGGVWSQWIQMYGMSSDDLRTLLRTVAEVFPYVNVYATIEDSDLVLVASDKPLEPTMTRAGHLLSWPKVRDELAIVEIDSPADLVSLHQFDQDAIHQLSEGAPLNTDDNMIIEYSAPRNLHRDTQDENLALITDHAQVPFLSVSDADDLKALAEAYEERNQVGRASLAIAEAIDRAPDAETAEQWRALATSWIEALDQEIAELTEE
ncbi:MAG: fused MFS/spermidine synthase [Myxococcota bacterium]